MSRYLKTLGFGNPSSTEFLKVELFGAIGDGITDDRQAMQNGINFCAEKGVTLMLDSAKTYLIIMGLVTNSLNSHCLNLPSNTRIVSNDSNKSTIKFLPTKTDGEYSLKTNNFTGGVAVPPGQVSAVYIDNSVTAKNNINVSDVHFTTDLIKWYNENECLTVVPLCFYIHNTTVEADFNNPLKDAVGYTFENCSVSNFKRGSVSVPGRALRDVTINGVTFEKISDKALELPSENLHVFTEEIEVNLPPNTTEFNFANGNLFDAGVYLYNSSDELLGVIMYSKEFNDAGLGSITNNVTTGGGLVQWTLGTLSNQVDHISVLGVKRTNETAGQGNINGVCLDGFAPAKNLIIENCIFQNSLTDQPDHYIYISRKVEGGIIRNNTIIGPAAETYQTGGGIHIRGASYTNFEIYGNTFINCKTQPFNFSSYTNFNVHDNNILLTKDMCLGPPGVTIAYGSGSGLTFENNTITNTNKVFSTALAPYGGAQLTAINVSFLTNNFSGLSTIGNVPTKNLLHDGNTYSTHENHKNNFIAFQHDTESDDLNVTFQNNTFNVSNPSFSFNLIEGFTGLTWINNILPSGMNIFRIGDTLKVINFTCTDSNFSGLQLNCSGNIVLTNVPCTLSYKSFAAYDDIVKNQSITCTNVTRTSGADGLFDVSGNTVPFLKSGSYNILASASGGNLDFLDIRPLTNTEGFQYSITNTGAHAITIRDIVNAVHANKNFSNGGVDKVWGVTETIVLSLDKANNQWEIVV